MRFTTATASTSLLELATERKAVAVCDEQLHMLSDLVTQYSEVVSQLSDPRIPEAELVKTVRKVLGKEVEEVVMNFFIMCLRQRSVKLLPKVAQRFRATAQRQGKLSLLEIATAESLTAAEMKHISAVYASRCAGEVRTSSVVDPAMGPGIRVRINGLVIESSLAGRLERFRRHIFAS